MVTSLWDYADVPIPGGIAGLSLFFSAFLRASCSWYCCSLFSRSLWLYTSSCSAQGNLRRSHKVTGFS